MLNTLRIEDGITYELNDFSQESIQSILNDFYKQRKHYPKNIAMPPEQYKQVRGKDYFDESNLKEFYNYEIHGYLNIIDDHLITIYVSSKFDKLTLI